MHKSERDRRTYKRYDYNYDITLDFLKKEIAPFTTKTINISERGAFIKTPADIDLFERFKGKLIIDDPETDYNISILFEGIIIRKELRLAFNQPDEYYAGIYFEHIEDSQLRKFRAFLKNKHKGLFSRILLKLLKLKDTIIDD